MAKFKKKSAAILLMFLVLPFVLPGQQRTGNIVEYFGKEKVEDIHEGKVIHVFDKALALSIPSFGFESSSFPVDPVFDKFQIAFCLSYSRFVSSNHLLDSRQSIL